MSLVDEYKKQYAWRDWTSAIRHCPASPGQRLLDLGCGPGDVAADLSHLGLLVTGIDKNAELLAAAKQLCPQCTFEQQDLRNLDLPRESFDGLWCSFTAAYFTDFRKTFSGWTRFLKKKAWVCIIDIDDLLGHEPLSVETRRMILEFYRDAVQARRYDFETGRKIGGILEELGFSVTTIDLNDKELAFTGPASPEVKQAWEDRFDRMDRLQSFLGERFTSFKEEFLQSISSYNHVSRCRVVCCVGTRG